MSYNFKPRIMVMAARYIILQYLSVHSQPEVLRRLLHYTAVIFVALESNYSCCLRVYGSIRITYFVRELSLALVVGQRLLGPAKPSREPLSTVIGAVHYYYSLSVCRYGTIPFARTGNNSIPAAYIIVKQAQAHKRVPSTIARCAVVHSPVEALAISNTIRNGNN